MLNISEMQKLSTTELTTLAAESDNRQYSLSLTAMVEAMKAHKLGDTKLMWSYIERAKTCLVRASEDERGQVRRVLDTQAVVVERGAALKVNSKVCATSKSLTVGFVSNWIGGVR